MYSNANVESGLITGTQWDVIMKWIENSGYNVRTDSSSFGNYANTIWTTSAMDDCSDYNIGNNWTSGTKGVADPSLGFSVYMKNIALFKTGSATTIANNIYDIAGNAGEWTSEMHSTNRVIRGGAASSNSYECPATYRMSRDMAMNNDVVTSFRVALYLK
jgi:formylglycine-generating enzyme required for sulfatase activity